jgi:hypothetical protein
MNYRFFLIILVTILSTLNSSAQNEKRSIRLGVDIGTGKQQFFPFNSPDYSYSTKGYKVIINIPLKSKKKISYELQLEPGIYSAKHQLLNEYYVQPEAGADYLDQRVKFTKEITITEYVLNAGMVVRYSFNESFSCFVLGSIGPMISGTETERLAKGFAFSDIFSFGAGYKVKNVLFEIRPGIRHVSNANTQKPNSGHNSSNIDFGISFTL